MERCVAEPVLAQARSSRRAFLKKLANVVALGLGTAHLADCLGGSGSDAASTTIDATARGSRSSATLFASTAEDALTVPMQTATNDGPMWQGSPTIEFVEGVPGVVSVRQFVQGPDNNPIAIQLRSGDLPLGMTWNFANATIEYDGRSLGAKPDAPVIVTGVTFSADDLRN